jgi:hypothetical protein
VDQLHLVGGQRDDDGLQIIHVPVVRAGAITRQVHPAGSRPRGQSLQSRERLDQPVGVVFVPPSSACGITRTLGLRRPGPDRAATNRDRRGA